MSKNLNHIARTKLCLLPCIVMILSTITLISCNRVKNKSKTLVLKMESKLKNLSDKIFPQLDAEEPDTKANKQEFKDYLTVNVTDDVRNIFAYSDFLGQDYKVLFFFNCDTKTINEVVKNKGMKMSAELDGGLLFQEEFHWWDKAAIALIKPFKVGSDDTCWEYLWFDISNHKAYFLSFSL